LDCYSVDCLAYLTAASMVEKKVDESVAWLVC